MRILDEVNISPEFYEAIEKQIKIALLRDLYTPLMAELEMREEKIKNAVPNFLIEDIMKSKIVHNKGVFRGKFNARTSKALLALGAKFDKKKGTFSLNMDKMPMDLRSAISASESRLSRKLKAIDDRLANILPEEIAESISLQKIFDANIYKMQKDIDATVKGISVPTNLTDESRALIARQYSDNVKLSIKSWTQDQVKTLREDVERATFAGNRFESMAASLVKNYGLSQNKAKFIARQESKLLMASFKEARYASAGVYEYTWIAVRGSADHPVRPIHQALADASKTGKIYRFDDPPVVNEKGDRKNPGEDYGCRCKARAVVRF